MFDVKYMFRGQVHFTPPSHNSLMYILVIFRNKALLKTIIIHIHNDIYDVLQAWKTLTFVKFGQFQGIQQSSSLLLCLKCLGVDPTYFCAHSIDAYNLSHLLQQR